MLTAMLNFGYSFPPGLIFFTSLLASWAWSAFLESIAWTVILYRQGVRQQFMPLVGWMGLVQILSTPLSFGVALVIYGALIWVLPMPYYFDILQQAVNLFWNPVGVFLGFFMVPILLEFFIWHQGWRWFVFNNRITIQYTGVQFSTIMLLAGVVIANACSFLFIFLIGFSYLIFIFVIFIGSFLILIVFGVLLWFLWSNRRIASPWFQDEPTENDSPSEGMNE
ncbi:MAG: hypothetical protein ACFFBR_00185 [Promethearchaeota archaeon]